ncbi:hypothetical protein ACO0LB_10070 [Undibacterium sp. SXout7W]|uniref:hypothetical protein n=1 Tax=Undibacterium sp. SXout7W TaxID=3413049 RepID=UPI003BEFB3DF
MIDSKHMHGIPGIVLDAVRKVVQEMKIDKDEFYEKIQTSIISHGSGAGTTQKTEAVELARAIFQ